GAVMVRAVRRPGIPCLLRVRGGARRGALPRPPVAVVQLPRLPLVPHGVVGAGLHQPRRLVRTPAPLLPDRHRGRPRPRLHHHRQPGQRRAHAPHPLRQLPQGEALRRCPRRPPRRRHLQRRRRRLAPPAQDGQPRARQRRGALLRVRHRRRGSGGAPPATARRRRRQWQGGRPPGRVPALRFRHHLQDLLRTRPGLPRARHAHVQARRRVRHRLAAIRHARRGGVAPGVEGKAAAERRLREGAQEVHPPRRRARGGHDKAAPEAGRRREPRPPVPVHGLGGARHRRRRQVPPRHRGQLPPRRTRHGVLRAHHHLHAPLQEPRGGGRRARGGRRRREDKDSVEDHVRAAQVPPLHPRGAAREHAAVPAGAVRLQVLRRRRRAPGRHVRDRRGSRDVPPLRHGAHAPHLGRRLREVPAGAVADGPRRDVRAGEPVQVPGIPGWAPRVPRQGARRDGDEGGERGRGEAVRRGGGWAQGRRAQVRAWSDGVHQRRAPGEGQAR
ncbi:hypothetical protein CFC21_080336, partial [Triticum aestivum]